MHRCTLTLRLRAQLKQAMLKISFSPPIGHFSSSPCHAAVKTKLLTWTCPRLNTRGRYESFLVTLLFPVNLFSCTTNKTTRVWYNIRLGLYQSFNYHISSQMSFRRGAPSSADWSQIHKRTQHTEHTLTREHWILFYTFKRMKLNIYKFTLCWTWIRNPVPTSEDSQQVKLSLITSRKHFDLSCLRPLLSLRVQISFTST